MAPQQGIVRDYQHAEGTSEQTTIDRSTYMPEMIKSLGRGFGDIAEMDRWNRTQKNTGSKQNKPDPAPLAEATAKMQEAFSSDESYIPEKKEDHLKQYYTWAYKQGYDNADIDAMIKEYGINDYTEDVTKFRKETAQRASDETQMAVDEGYKIDPTARTPQQALIAFNKAMLTNQVIDAKTKAVKNLGELDKDYANHTLKSLVPDLARDINTRFNAWLSENGEGKLTQQTIEEMKQTYSRELIDKGLPEWYADYVTDWSFYPYMKIAKSTDAERVKATESADNYIKNLVKATEMGLLNVPLVEGYDETPLSIQIKRDILGNDAVARLMDHSGAFTKELLSGKFGPAFKEALLKASAQNPEDMKAFLISAPKEIKQKTLDAQTENLDVLKGVVQSIKNSDKTPTSLSTVDVYSKAAPDVDNESAELINHAAEARDIPNYLNSLVQDERDLFGKDKLVRVDSVGHATLFNVEGSSVVPVDDWSIFSSKVEYFNRALRELERDLAVRSKRTGMGIPKLAAMHNDVAESFHKGLGVELSDDTKKLFRSDKDSYENSPAKQEWDSLSTEEQLAEMNKGE